MVAERMNNLSGQPMFDILARARRRKDMIHFEIGDTYFNTPENISNAAIKSIQSGETHYCESGGLPDFIHEIKQTTLRSRGFMPQSDQVLVTPGANIGIYYAAITILNPGDEVIIPDPYFPTYKGAFEFVGAKICYCPLWEHRDFEIDPDEIKSFITEKTRLIVINSPQNPTGAVLSESNIQRIYEIACEYKCYILSDEVYSRTIYDGKFSSPSAYDECKERVIVLNGFGKAFAMTGWRLGAIIAPTEIIQKMSLFLQLTSSCVPPFIQRAGIAALHNSAAADKMAARYEHKRNLIAYGLNKIKGIECQWPKGAFYVFPNIEATGLTDIEFAEKCMQSGVAVMPGTCFGKQGAGHIRMCFAVEDSKIVEGLIRIEDMLAGR